eukprot:14751531-Alexandrium_andersonii.AAC.1
MRVMLGDAPNPIGGPSASSTGADPPPLAGGQVTAPRAMNFPCGRPAVRLPPMAGGAGGPSQALPPLAKGSAGVAGDAWSSWRPRRGQPGLAGRGFLLSSGLRPL